MEVNVNHLGSNCFSSVVDYVRKGEEDSPKFSTFKKVCAFIATTVVNFTPIGMVTSTMFVREYMHQSQIVKWMNGVGEEETTWVTARKIGVFALAFLQIFTVFGIVTFGVFLYEWYCQSEDMSVVPQPEQILKMNEQQTNQQTQQQKPTTAEQQKRTTGPTTEQLKPKETNKIKLSEESATEQPKPIIINRKESSQKSEQEKDNGFFF